MHPNIGVFSLEDLLVWLLQDSLDRKIRMKTRLEDYANRVFVYLLRRVLRFLGVAFQVGLGGFGNFGWISSL